MNEFLTFNKMITPVFIQIIFWIGVAVCVIGGFIGIISGAGMQYGGGGAVLRSLILMILGPLGVRIYCEILIVLFRMNDSLIEIKKNTGR